MRTNHVLTGPDKPDANNTNSQVLLTLENGRGILAAAMHAGLNFSAQMSACKSLNELPGTEAAVIKVAAGKYINHDKGHVTTTTSEHSKEMAKPAGRRPSG
jgi:hypothetical protein